MSDDTLLQRYLTRGEGGGASRTTSLDVEAMDEDGSFGWLRGMRERSVSLELRRRTGNILAVGYGYLERAEFDPSEGITLSVGGLKVRIKGRNLNAEIRPMVRLFQGIVRHRVSWIQEAGNPELMHSDDRATVVESIAW